MQELSSVLTLAVTDSPEHAVEDPAHDGVIFTELSTKLIAPSSPTSFERVFLGTGPTPALAAPTVNAIVGRHIDTGAILSKASIDSLCLEGVDALEVAHTYALRSRGMPITRFQF